MFSLYLLLLCSVLVSLSSSTTTTCDDSYSCLGEEIEDSYIYCRGNYACYNGYEKATDYLYCTGNYGCYLSVIESEGNVQCGGYYGCILSEITNVDNYLYSYGAWGTAYSFIAGNNDFEGNGQLTGHYSGSYSSLSGMEYIYAYGYFSLYQASIDSENVDRMFLYSYGYYAGYYSAIYCRSGSHCFIYCSDEGCRNMRLIQYSGSTVTISCDNSCDYCPTQYNITDDSELLRLNKEDLIPENRLLLLTQKRDEMKTKSNEFVETYGKEQGLEKFAAWNEENIGNEIKELQEKDKVDEKLNVKVIDSSNKLYVENGLNNENNHVFSQSNSHRFKLISIISVAFIIGLIVCYFAMTKCNKKDKLLNNDDNSINNAQYDSVHVAL